jgi:hypothetical protein
MKASIRPLLSPENSQKKKKYKRKVDWREYDESLGRRGELLFDTDFLSNWLAELKQITNFN